tara:strand:- start:140 stop:319 length:180 start_codon:yes stop_codon:yes gene_type:complete
MFKSYNENLVLKSNFYILLNKCRVKDIHLEESVTVQEIHTDVENPVILQNEEDVNPEEK